MEPREKLPLFIISGAWGIGKSTIAEKLPGKGKNYIVLDGRAFWNDCHNLLYYRKKWIDLCYNLFTQLCLPVVFFTDEGTKLFDGNIIFEIHYISLVSDEETHRKRLRSKEFKDIEEVEGPAIFCNNKLRTNVDPEEPTMSILDTTDMTPEESADIVDQWIMERMI